MKKDSSNKNNARSALEQLRLERETSDGMVIYLGIDWKIYQWMSFVFGVIICLGWLRTKFSCEVHHGL